MQAVNVKNIALSLCLGMFSFHTYVVNTSSVTYSKDFGLFDPGSRSIAAAGDCTQARDLNINSLLATSYQPEECKYIIQMSATEATATADQAVRIRFVFKQGEEVVYQPAEGEPLHLLELTDFSTIVLSDEGKSEFTTEQRLKVRDAAAKFYREQLPSVQEQLRLANAPSRADRAHNNHADRNQATAPETDEDTQAGSAIDGEDNTNSETSTNDEVQATVITVDDEVDVTPSSSEAVVSNEIDNESDVDEEGQAEELGSLLNDLDRLIEKAENCEYTSDSQEEIESIKNKITRAIGQDSEIRSFSRVRSNTLSDLSEYSANRIFDQSANIDELLEAQDEVGIDDKITCLSKNAISQETAVDQLVYYNVNIRPVIMDAVDSDVENLSDLETLFNSIGSNDAFKSLNIGNSLIDASTTQEQNVAVEALTCKQRAEVAACATELTAQANSAKQTLLTSSDESIKIQAAAQLDAYNHWIEKLGGAAVALEAPTTGSGVIDDILEEGNKMSAAQQALLSGQANVLQEAKSLNETLSNEALEGSNARTSQVKVFAPERQQGFTVDEEGTPVSREELNSLD